MAALASRPTPLVLLGTLATTSAWAQTSAPVGQPETTEVTVVEARTTPVTGSDDASSGAVFSREAVEARAGASRTSPYRVLEYLPSIHVEGTDGLGLNLDQNALRVRGQLGDSYARLASTIERVPLSINVGQGAMGNLLDLENVDGLSFYRGPMPADRGFGLGTTAGELDLHILRPAKDPGLRMVLAGGASRGSSEPVPLASVFVRADVGDWGWGVRPFVSASYNHARKWRGFGSNDRVNGTAGIAKAFGDRVDVAAYAIVNHVRMNEYRSLSYAQTQDRSLYRSFDYTHDGGYLDYRNNRQQVTELAALMEVRVRLGRWGSLLVEPYLGSVDGVRYFGSEPNPKVNGVNRMVLSQSQLGALTELRLHPWHGLGVAAGVWVSGFASVPPPADQKFYAVAADGSLQFSRWNMLSETGTRLLASPYAAVTGLFGRFSWDAGLRLVALQMPSVKGYDPSGLPDQSASDAISHGAPLRPGLQADAQTQMALLPHLGLRYAFSEAWSARLAYGRNYAYPFQGPLFSTYNSNAENFGNLGMTLDDIWRGLKLEISDNVDVGVHFSNSRVSVRPTLYYARFHDKQVLAYDAAVGVPYYQSVASAEAKGAELEVAVAPWTWLSTWFAGSFNQTQFTQDLATKASTPLATTGKQFADAPRWLGKLGATARWHPFTLSPFLRYVGARYGDLMNGERVDAYCTLDVMLGYHLDRLGWVRDFGISLRGQNILDSRYIAIIRNQQDISEALSTTYYPGAPMLWMLSLEGRFAGRD